MNCLLLLIILFCCGGNGCSGNGCGNSCGRSCDNYKRCDVTPAPRMGNCNVRESCEPVNQPCQTPPPMPRTQFPYLDVEPRTCGCEEKQNS